MASVARLLLVARAGPLADGLSLLLRTIPGVEVVGRVDGLRAALAAISELGPTAVVLDSGPFAERTLMMVSRLAAVLSDGKCIVLADDVRQQRAAERAGADAVLLKGCRPAELVGTVRGLLVAEPALPMSARGIAAFSASSGGIDAEIRPTHGEHGTT